MEQGFLTTTMERVLLVLLFLVPTIFLRSVSESFDLVKATSLWLFALPLLSLLPFALVQQGISRSLRALWPIVMFWSAAVAVTITSPFIEVSVFGQAQRYTGLLTITAVSVVAASLYLIFKHQSLIKYSVTFCVAYGVLIVYAIIQHRGEDPFVWGTSSTNVFSTIGNPNTATAFVSVATSIIFGTHLGLRERSKIGGWVTLLLLAASGWVISAFESFQGSIACLGVWIVFATWKKGRTTHWRQELSAFLLAFLISVFAFLPSTTLTLFLEVSLTFFAGLLNFARQSFLARPTFPSIKIASTRLRFWLIIVPMVAFTGFLLFGKFRKGFASGFLERGDFWRAARDMFLSRPLVGTGLETYGFFYPSFRPSTHAVRFEEYRSSSAHNIYLGMFSNGGLVLGVAYLSVILFVALKIVRFLRIKGPKDPLLLGYIAAFVAFQLISIVSVEHVALSLLNFSIIGLVLGGCATPGVRRSSVGETGERHPVRARKSAQARFRINLLAVPILLVMILVGGPFVTKPYRAASLAFEGESLVAEGKFDEAERKFEKSALTYGSSVQSRLVLSQLRFKNQDFVEASLYAKDALEMTRYSGSLSGLMVSIIFRSNFVTEAVIASRQAHLNDPYAPSLQRQFAEVLYLAASVEDDVDPEVAQKYIDEARSRFPDYQSELIDAKNDSRDS